MRRISISLKTARAIVRALDEAGEFLAATVAEELRAAMKPKPAVKSAERRRSAKRATKKEETADIRAAVMERAGGACEICGAHETNLSPLELHHALGRVRARQAAENCLASCRSCHRNITENRPSADVVLLNQAAVFGRLGLHGTVGLLLKRRDFVLARGAA